MSTRMATFAAFTFAAVGASTAGAQAPPPPPGVAPPPAVQMNASPVASGRVKQFIVNPNGDIDGFFLADGAQVNFPPHLTPSLVQTVRTGDQVSVQGFKSAEGNVIRASAITNSTTKRTVVDQPPTPDRPPRAPPALTALSVDGKVVQLLHADMGEVNGAILDDGTIVRWPPPVGAQLFSSLALNSSMKASGFGSQSAYGKALEATTVAINGQAAVVVYGPGPGTGPGAVPGRTPAPPPGRGAPSAAP